MSSNELSQGRVDQITRMLTVQEPPREHREKVVRDTFERSKERLRLACAAGKFSVHELRIKIEDTRVSIMRQTGVDLPEYTGELEQTINHALEPPPPLDQTLHG